MTLHRWPYKAKNCEIHDPKSLKNKLDGPWVAFLAKKGRGVATVVCVSHGYRSKLPSIHSNTHKTMATPLLLCYQPMIRQATLGSIFNFFEGVNEGNLKKWSEGNYTWTCRICLDFFVWWLFMQNRDFRASKGPFLGQKTNFCQTTVTGYSSPRISGFL